MLIFEFNLIEIENRPQNYVKKMNYANKNAFFLYFSVFSFNSCHLKYFTMRVARSRVYKKK